MRWGLRVEGRSLSFSGPLYPPQSGALMGVILGLSLSPEPIRLIVRSCGGAVYQALGIYDLIKAIPNEVIVEAPVGVSSAAIIVWMAGSQRLTLPDGQFLTHPIEGGDKRLTEEVAAILHPLDISHCHRYNGRDLIRAGICTESPYLKK